MSPLGMLVDLTRNGQAGVTSVAGRIFPGVALGLENGVSISSDA